MVAIHTPSDVISALDTGNKRANSAVHGAPLREAIGRVTPAADSDVGSIHRMIRLPSNARISSLEMAHDAVSAGAADIGVYAATGHQRSTLAENGLILIEGNTAADGGGSVIDVDYFCSAVTFLAAGVTSADGTGAAGTGLIATNTKYNLLTESATNTLAKQVQPLWQALGFTTDPGGDFDIAITVTTQFGGLTDIALRCRYTC